MLLLATGLFVALRLAGVTDWLWWWVLAPLWVPAAGQLTSAAIVWLGYRRQLRRSVQSTVVEVSTFRRAGGPGSGGRAPALTVSVRITLKGSMIDWSLVDSRQELTGQVMGIIEGEYPDIRQMLDEKLHQQGWTQLLE
jgi:hypothetical protein